MENTMSNIDRISSLDNDCWGIVMKKLLLDEYDWLIDKYGELRERFLVLLRKHNITPCKPGEFRTLYSDEYKVLIKDFEDFYEELQNLED